jgi:hypothetical protein
MVHTVIPNNSIVGIGYVLNTSERGKIALPVEPATLVYSYFKHVSGVPAPEGSLGVTISKLNILDILIERMSQIRKNGNMADFILSEDSMPVPEDHLDALIEAYKAQIRDAAEAHAVMPYMPAPMAQAGAVFNFLI